MLVDLIFKHFFRCVAACTLQNFQVRAKHIKNMITEDDIKTVDDLLCPEEIYNCTNKTKINTNVSELLQDISQSIPAISKTTIGIQIRKEISGFAPGDTCSIVNLKKTPEYNNECGVIGDFFEDSDTYEVTLLFGETLKVPVANLEMVYLLITRTKISSDNDPQKEIGECHEKCIVAIQERRFVDASKSLKKICILMENCGLNRHVEFCDYYWNIKFKLLSTELEIPSESTYEELKISFFQIMKNATCQHLQIKTLNIFADYVIACNRPKEECQEVLDMLEMRVRKHYGHIGSITLCMASLFRETEGDLQAAVFLETVVPECETNATLKRHERFYLISSYTSIYLNEIHNDEMIKKGHMLINAVVTACAEIPFPTKIQEVT